MIIFQLHYSQGRFRDFKILKKSEILLLYNYSAHMYYNSIKKSKFFQFLSLYIGLSGKFVPQKI